ncbi:hypothetical protein HZS_635 [Henneguya salminicola]|nr:hypothetical protein HZS_635 [Henneguya salminicola]
MKKTFATKNIIFLNLREKIELFFCQLTQPKISKRGFFSSTIKPDSLFAIKNELKICMDKIILMWNRNIRKNIKFTHSEKDQLIVFCVTIVKEQLEFVNIITYDIIEKDNIKEISEALLNTN